MSKLNFGWAEIDITPDKKVSLAGQFAERISEYVEKPLTATAMAVTGFALIPANAVGISVITGILRAGGDIGWSTFLDLAPQWLLALPLTALFALILQSNCWLIAIAIQTEFAAKVPLCIWRMERGNWIHDVTRTGGVF